jgi:glycosyltransferase involved in cell wall biosynthesis
VTEVVIDGVSYTPDRPSVGIAITTRNRRDVFDKTLTEFQRLTPGALIVVVDDASDEPVPGAIRFDTNVGIARAKNAGITALMDAGVEHLFLADDDTYPIVEEWWRPYVESPEPHLMLLFKDVDRKRRLDTPPTVYEDDKHIAMSHPRGCLLYIHRIVVDRVGGMRPEFGLWGHEHVEYSTRIHNAGLTTHRFQDVKGSAGLLYSIDEHYVDHPTFKRAVDAKVRTEHLQRNEAIFARYKTSTDFVPYQEPRDVVITCLFTGRPDPQRGTRMKADSSLLTELRKSIRGAKLVVTHDQLTDFDDQNTEFVRAANTINVYFQRHIAAWQYLRDHPEIRWAWCVDGTDVKMLREPWEHMQPGLLYLGSEPAVAGIPWMRDNHPAAVMQEFITANANRQLLNAGLIGGDRATVMSFLHDLIALHADNAEAVARGTDKDLGIGDMAALNYIAWTRYADRLVWGSMVNTVFKRNEVNDFSWWAHK